MCLSFSDDFIHWKRYEGNPILDVRKDWYDHQMAAEGKIYKDGDHWTMLYAGVNFDKGDKRGAHIMAAFSLDLLHWTADPEPLYKAGGHPTGLDKTYAHKISLVYNPKNDTMYMFYCAVGNKGRCIGLLTNKKID